MPHLSLVVGAPGPNRQADWATFVMAGLLAIGSGVSAVRVWRGEPIVRRSSMNSERGLEFPNVTIGPVAIGFSAVAIGQFCLNLGGRLGGPAEDSIWFAIAFLAGILFLGAVVLALSLLMFGMPRALVPPSLRR